VGPSLTEVLHARFVGEKPDSRQQSTHQYQAAKSLIAQAGSLSPQKLSAAHVIEIDTKIPMRYKTAATRYCHANALRFILRWLWEYHGSPKLDSAVRHYPAPRPRNVTVTDEERARLFQAAPPYLRLWLLLCSDLALRSGTAVTIGPHHYDAQKRLITFTTKYDEHMTMPITAEIAELVATCSLDDPLSFVRQLWTQHRKTHHARGCATVYCVDSLREEFKNLCIRLGITRGIRPHDLRRTTAVAVLEHTSDIREVQALLGHKNLSSTFWYLDHSLRPIKRSTLELVKRPAWRKEKSA
jgi:integrase